MGEKETWQASDYATQKRFDEGMLVARTDAALQGHRLTSFRSVRGMTAREAFCRRCEMAIYVSEWGIHSFLADRCPNSLGE